MATDPLDAPMGRVPRLDVYFGVAGAAVGYLTAEVATVPYGLPVSHQALVVAGVVGALVGAASRFWIEREPPYPTASQLWVPSLATWLIGGILTSAIVVLGSHYHAYGALQLYAYKSFGTGVLASAFSLPACAWLIAKAREARRARLGSLVAARDVRGLVGALLASISLGTLTLVPMWRFAAIETYNAPWVALGVTGVAAVGALLLLARDMAASRRCTRLVVEVEDLACVGGDAAVGECAGGLDVGVGDELYVRDSVVQDYRSGRRRVPLVRGTPLHASTILRRAVRLSWIRAAVVAVPFLVHGFVAKSPPELTAWERYIYLEDPR